MRHNPHVKAKLYCYFRSERTKRLNAPPCTFEDSCTKRLRFSVAATMLPCSLRFSTAFKLEHLRNTSSDQVAVNVFSASCFSPFPSLGAVKLRFGWSKRWYIRANLTLSSYESEQTCPCYLGSVLPAGLADVRTLWF